MDTKYKITLILSVCAVFLLSFLSGCVFFLGAEEEENESGPAQPGVQEYFKITLDGDFCDGFMVFADAYEEDDTVTPVASVSKRITASDRTLSFPIDKEIPLKGISEGGGHPYRISYFL